MNAAPNVIFSNAGERPNENSFGASGSQVAPDFARPAGPESGFQYTASIFYLIEIVVRDVFSIPCSILHL